MVRLLTGPVTTALEYLATGFSVAGVADVAFVVVGNGQWSRPPVIAKRHLPGSNSVVRQMLGFDARTVTYELILETVDALAILSGLQGQVGMLTLRPETAAVDIRQSVVIAGKVYDRIFDATLVSVDPPGFSRGATLASATFEVEDD